MASEVAERRCAEAHVGLSTGSEGACEGTHIQESALLSFADRKALLLKVPGCIFCLKVVFTPALWVISASCASHRWHSATRLSAALVLFRWWLTFTLWEQLLRHLSACYLNWIKGLFGTASHPLRTDTDGIRMSKTLQYLNLKGGDEGGEVDNKGKNGKFSQALYVLSILVQ